MLGTQPRSIVTVDSATYVEDISQLTINGESEPGDPNSVVFCTGKEVFHYPFPSDGSYHIDKRSYKGGALPSTIRICPKTGKYFHKMFYLLPGLFS